MFPYVYLGNHVLGCRVNMSIEERMLRMAAEERVAPIRFYSFGQEGAVLGYAQSPASVKYRGTDFAVVRRITGGSHVYVGPNAFAYSVAIPRNGEFRTHGDMRAYFAESIAYAYADLGVKEIEVDNKASTINSNGSIVSSHAIIWGRDSALLHGILYADPLDVERVSQRVHLGERRIGSETYTEQQALQNIPAVSALISQINPNLPADARLRIARELLGSAILQRVTKGRYTNYPIDRDFVGNVTTLARQKFSSPVWTNDRLPPFSQQEVEEIPGEELAGELKKNLGYCLFLQVTDKDFKKMAQPKE